MAFPGVLKKLNEARMEKAVTCLKLVSLKKQHEELELLVSCQSTELHTFVATWGEFTLTLEDMARLTLLLMFREANARGSTLRERAR